MDFRLLPFSLAKMGINLHRPESVLATQTGDIAVPDWRGGITIVRHDGTQRFLVPDKCPVGLRPNGITLAPDGSFLLANLGDDGGVWRLESNGRISEFLLEVDGVRLPPTNYVTTDDAGRIWITVSTRARPRHRAWRSDVSDGFLILVDRHGAHIVADGFCYTNECHPDRLGQWLYVVETFGRRIVRLPITRSGLGRAEEVVALGDGCWPDGFAFDQEGGIWITSLISNRLLHFDGSRLRTVIEETDVAFVDRAETAFRSGLMLPEHLGQIPGTRLQHVTSISFGGFDLKTAYLGCLHTDCVFTFQSPVAGVPSSYSNVLLP